MANFILYIYFFFIQKDVIYLNIIAEYILLMHSVD